MVPDTSGNLFIQDIDKVVVFNSGGQQIATVPLETSTLVCPPHTNDVLPPSCVDGSLITEPPVAGKMIIAGDGNAYVPYLYNIETTGSKASTWMLLRVSPDGSYSKLLLGNNESAIPDLFAADSYRYSGTPSPLSVITNADKGVAVVTPQPVDSGTTGELIYVSGDAITSQVSLPFIYADAMDTFWPQLQREDGTYIGTVGHYCPGRGYFSPCQSDYGQLWNQNGMSIAAVGLGGVLWQQQFLSPVTPLYATSDGGLIITSTTKSVFGLYVPTQLGTLYSLDRAGNITSQSADAGLRPSWTGQWYGVASGALADSISPIKNPYFDSSFWPTSGANPSDTSNSSFFTKTVTVIGWIDKSAVSVPPTASVNPALVNALASSCTNTLRKMSNGDRSLILSDVDRQYANAFLITNSGNNAPPETLDPSVLSRGDFRAYNEAHLSLTRNGNQISKVVPSNPKPALGNTPDACNSYLVKTLDFLLGVLKPDPHPDNGKYGATANHLHAFQLAEGRVGSDGQAVNRTLNWCTSRDASGSCNSPVQSSTPYIWEYPLFDAQGNYTLQTQIFPTYYIYENGKLVTKRPQSALETFVSLDAQSQVKANDIQ